MFRWRLHDTEQEREKKQALSTFARMRQEPLKERNQAVFSQRNDNHLLIVLLSDLNRFEATLTPQALHDDIEEWERRVNRICELEESMKQRKFTIRRLDNTISNCSRHMAMLENM